MNPDHISRFNQDLASAAESGHWFFSKADPQCYSPEEMLNIMRSNQLYNYHPENWWIEDPRLRLHGLVSDVQASKRGLRRSKNRLSAWVARLRQNGIVIDFTKYK